MTTTHEAPTDAATAAPPTEVDVLVIGAGFSGLGMGHRLRQAGHTDFLILERGAVARRARRQRGLVAVLVHEQARQGLPVAGERERADGAGDGGVAHAGCNAATPTGVSHRSRNGLGRETTKSSPPAFLAETRHTTCSTPLGTRRWRPVASR